MHYPKAVAAVECDADTRNSHVDTRKLADDNRNAAYNTQSIADSPKESLDGNKKYRYCATCKGVKPERAHHCRRCNKCYLRMDHHCYWINNCVGHSNHKFFLMFILYALIISTLVLVTSILELKDTAVGNKEFEIVKVRCL
eukprot:TRINITY_DN12857_c0_g1_i8.p1 TRINITY_DN12857_c0_g1~~TRINITY_DN12857_c0_g1_i8.p1  ORF type:complete len:141 (+),score=19.78 TRINITY_DN12857_c0_g1_i8:344-766(+)